MDHARLVRGLQRQGDLPCDGQHLVQGDRSLFEAFGEGRALDQLQDQRARAAGLLEAVDLGDVGVVQRGEDPGLSLEARQPVRVGGERLGQHLQRDVAVELRVAGAVHLAHAAGPERAGDVIGADPCSGRQGHDLQPSSVSRRGGGRSGNGARRGHSSMNLTVSPMALAMSVCRAHAA